MNGPAAHHHDASLACPDAWREFGMVGPAEQPCLCGPRVPRPWLVGGTMPASHDRRMSCKWRGVSAGSERTDLKLPYSLDGIKPNDSILAWNQVRTQGGNPPNMPNGYRRGLPRRPARNHQVRHDQCRSPVPRFESRPFRPVSSGLTLVWQMSRFNVAWQNAAARGARIVPMARVRHNRRYLTTSYATLTAISGSLEATFVEMTFCNVSSSARTIKVRFVPSGATAGDQHLVISLSTSNALQPGETRVYSFQPFLQPGDAIAWQASAGSAVTADAAINEE